MRNVPLEDIVEVFHMEQQMGSPPEEGLRFTPLHTGLDLCPECAANVFAATGCLSKIIREYPRPQREPEGEPRKDPEEPRGEGKSSWAHVAEDDT